MQIVSILTRGYSLKSPATKRLIIILFYIIREIISIFSRNKTYDWILFNPQVDLTNYPPATRKFGLVMAKTVEA